MSEATTTYYRSANPTRDLLAEVQQRLPAGLRVVQEAFTSDHCHPVLIPLQQLTPNTFYFFDDISAHAFSDAVVELAGAQTGGRLTVSYPFSGEFRAQEHRLQHLAHKLDQIRVLAIDSPRSRAGLGAGVEFRNIAHSPLARFRFAINEEARPLLFISRDTRLSPIADGARCLGFFSFDPDVVAEIAEDIDQILHGVEQHMSAFHRLELLHRATQKVTRELDSYSRRMELAIQRARRRPDLLTPHRLDRILGQAAAKMRELEEIPLRAMRAIERAKR